MIIGPATAAVILAREADLKRGPVKPVITRRESSRNDEKDHTKFILGSFNPTGDYSSPQDTYSTDSLDHIAATTPSHLIGTGRESRSVYAGTANQRKNAAHRALEDSSHALKLTRGDNGFDDYFGVLDLKRANQVQSLQILDNERVITYNKQGRVIEDRELRRKEARGLRGMHEPQESTSSGLPPGPMGMAIQAVLYSAIGAVPPDDASGVADPARVAPPVFDLSTSLRQLNDFEDGLRSYVANFDSSGDYSLNEFAGLGIDSHEKLAGLLDIVVRERPGLSDLISKARGIDYHRQAVEELTAYYDGITSGADRTALDGHLRNYVVNQRQALDHYKSIRFVEHLSETLRGLGERVPTLRKERETIQERIGTLRKTIEDYGGRISTIRGRRTRSGLFPSDLSGVPNRTAIDALFAKVDAASGAFDSNTGQAHRNEAIAIVQEALDNAQNDLADLEGRVRTYTAAEDVINSRLGSLRSLHGRGYGQVQAERRRARGTEVNLGLTLGIGDESETINPAAQPITVTCEGVRSNVRVLASIGSKKEQPRLYASMEHLSVDDGTINTPNPGTYTREGHLYKAGFGFIRDLSNDRTVYVGLGIGSSKDVRTYAYPSDPGSNQTNSRDGTLYFGHMQFRGESYELRLNGVLDQDNDRDDRTIAAGLEAVGLWGNHGELALLYDFRDVDSSQRIDGERYTEHAVGFRVATPTFGNSPRRTPISLVAEWQGSDISEVWRLGVDLRPKRANGKLVVAYRAAGSNLERENPLETRTDDLVIHTFSAAYKF
ncbi:hypothetical protein KY361_07055 [Candidatus Woesearchaeota archaeon]|nr:hypothetical protein [Candidatus Woesearchaeota archaeon]